MRPLLIATSLSVFTTALSAQTSLEAATDVGVYARANTGVALKFIPKGTKITRPASVTAAVGGRDTTRASATTSAGTRTSRDGVGAGVSESAFAVVRGRGSASAGTTAGRDARSFTPGAHSFLLTIPAPKDAKVSILISYEGRATSDKAKASAEVDVGADSKVEFKASADGKKHTMRVEATAGDRGVVVKMTTSSSVALTQAGQAGVKGALLVLAKRGGGDKRCSFERFGTSCGPVLSGAEETSSRGTIARFKTTNAKSPGAAIFLMGARRISVRIPGTRCLLHTVPVITFTRAVQRGGTAEIAFLVPKDFEGFTVNQDFILSGSARQPVAETTNGLVLKCRKAQ